MKHLLKISVSLIVLSCITASAGHAQFWRGGWQVDASYALIAHDKRLFGYPAGSSNTILNDFPETFGTHEWGMMVNKRVIKQNIYQLTIGLGCSRETQAFGRPTNRIFAQSSGDYKARRNKLYEIFSAQTKIINTMRLKNVLLNLVLMPKFNFYRKIKTTSGTFSTNKLQFWSIELSPEIGYLIGPIEPYIGYRLSQLKKKDDSYVYHDIFEGLAPDYKVEWYNPTKLIFGIRWHINHNR